MTILPLILGILLAAPLADEPPESGTGNPPETASEATRNAEDRIKVTIAPAIIEALREKPPVATSVPPRLLVLMCETEGPVGGRDPIEAPFFRRPQPIRSIPIDLRSLDAETTLQLGDDAADVAAVPRRVDDLEGRFAIRAVLDLGTARGHDAAGNPISGIVEASLARGRADEISLRLDERIEESPLPDRDGIVWVELESPLLSKSLGRPVLHRAGVVLPPGYDDLDHPRRFWPTIYEIPGFGGDHRDAVHWRRMQGGRRGTSIAPPAVVVVLDPNDPLGHHGFVDGDNTGPRATALVEEFIPWLESRFRLVAEPNARLLHGHSSGAWSSLWLQLEHPEVFGACFASAPDPVDFSAFQAIDLHRDDSMWTDADGDAFPSYREPLGPDLDRVLMTVEDEMSMERALAPDGTSGEQWSAWNAMFSGRDPATGLPRAGFDLATGAIDHEVIARDWSRFDITARLRRDPERYAPILRDRVRLMCGSRDSYYLERAVRRLSEALDDVDPPSDDDEHAGSIEIVEGATHDTVVGHAMSRWLPEMRRLCE
ncbi:MAG: hypothetical protein RLZZ461_995 [Planctomycetota bacterium]|jgi:hypothetical protein